MSTRNPSFAAPQMNDEIISSLDLMHEPEVFRSLVGRYPKQRELGWLKEMGWTKKVNQTTFKHHEENTLFQAPIIAAKANSGSNIVLTLASDNHYQSGKYSFPRVGNLVEFVNGSTGLIIAKDTTTDSAHTVTVAPVNAATDVQAAAVVGDNFMCYSNADVEGGVGLTETLIPTTETFDHQLQIFRDKHEVTSSEQSNQTYIEFTNPSTGQKEKRLYIKGEADTADRFNLQREFGLFLSNKSDANLVNADSKLVRTTEGLIPQLKNRANLMDYSAQPTKETYDRLCKIINKNYGGSEYQLWHGLDYAIANTSFSNDFGQAGGIVYSSFGSEGKERAIKMGFNSIMINGYTFHLKPLNILSYSDTTGAAGFGYSQNAIAMPTEKMMDAKTHEMMDPVCVRYKEMSGKGSRGQYKVWETGGNSDAGTDESLVRKVNYAAEEGLQLFGAKRAVYITKK